MEQKAFLFRASCSSWRTPFSFPKYGFFLFSPLPNDRPLTPYTCHPFLSPPVWFVSLHDFPFSQMPWPFLIPPLMRPNTNISPPHPLFFLSLSLWVFSFPAHALRLASPAHFCFQRDRLYHANSYFSLLFVHVRLRLNRIGRWG